MEEKQDIYKRYSENADITDITDGSAYRSLMDDNKFLSGSENTNITATFNTDGICLFKSTHVELWPLYVVINELPPHMRFARENILLLGIWQGRGKPPFQSFLTAFGKEITKLFNNGVKINFDGKDICVKLAIICASVDLQAKAGVLNMTLFNGAFACITCEEEGFVAAQGKGHTRCYPYRLPESRSSMRSNDSVLQCMRKGSTQNRCKGFKGQCGIQFPVFNIVTGFVPDYMHGILLGTCKTLMTLWFAPKNSRQPYFIGNQLPVISSRHSNIKPVDYMVRLPRNIEKDYASLKATEYQAWLLYYGLPCLKDILPMSYLDHFSLLSEAVHLLLSDTINQEILNRASVLLDLFYKQFQPLYGDGSCGLNVHNIGAHLADFVHLWGPIWAWSCFSFEDINSMVLKSTHGTGNVTKQIMQMKEAESVIKIKCDSENAICVKPWSKLKVFNNCEVAGKLIGINADEQYNEEFLQLTNAKNICSIKKVTRVLLNGHKLYSEMYTRMKKRNCNCVLLKDGGKAMIKFFIVNVEVNDVYAAVTLLEDSSSSLDELTGGKHIKPVKETCTFKILSVNYIVEKLFFIDTKTNCLFISRVASMHGHSIFK